ncbi:MAG: MFS transporter [Anaerolineales bacterium]|nr:MFS transporter [Anaerolineales bacterium]
MAFFYLLIEFLDELVFGVSAAATPLMRDDLALTYIQIGLLFSIPGLIANFIEPFMFILGDVWKRRVILLAGGVLFTLSLALTSVSTGFILLLFSYILFYPASGMFVSLSQSNLMDLEPSRHEQNMARWTFAGSLGVVIGPLLLSALLTIGLGWRPAFGFLAVLTVMMLILVWGRIPAPGASTSLLPELKLVFAGLRNTFLALRGRSVLRWLVLLEFSDLMLDVLYGFLPLYFVDVVGFTTVEAAASVAVWTGVGLLGDFLLIPLLERVKGMHYLRWSVLIELVLFPAFLLVSIPWLKLVIIGAVGFFNAGWYTILKANLFSAMPGQSGITQALDNVSSMFGKLLPFGIGLAAQSFGLGAAMWLLLAGPLALLVGLPHRSLPPLSQGEIQGEGTDD